VSVAFVLSSFVNVSILFKMISFKIAHHALLHHDSHEGAPLNKKAPNKTKRMDKLDSLKVDGRSNSFFYQFSPTQ
jgi:hypothetical protein